MLQYRFKYNYRRSNIQITLCVQDIRNSDVLAIHFITQFIYVCLFIYMYVRQTNMHKCVAMLYLILSRLYISLQILHIFEIKCSKKHLFIIVNYLLT